MDFFWILIIILIAIVLIALIIVIVYFATVNNSNTTLTITPLTSFSNGIKVPTSGGNAAVYNYYETGTVTVTYSGAIAGTAVWQFTRNGNTVTVNIPNTSLNFVSVMPISVANYPSRLLPRSIPTNCDIIVIDNGAAQTTSGKIAIPTNGNLTIFKNFINSTFTGPGQVGHDNNSFTYNVN